MVLKLTTSEGRVMAQNKKHEKYEKPVVVDLGRMTAVTLKTGPGADGQSKLP